MSGNIYSIGQNVFRFRVWNLLGAIEGHITVYWHRASELWCFRQHGDYGNLISYLPRNDSVRWPTEAEKRLVEPFIERQLNCAAWFSYPDHTKGEYLREQDRAQKVALGYLPHFATVFHASYLPKMHSEPFDNESLKLFESASVTIW